MGFKKETGGLQALGSLGEVNPLGEAVLETGCFFLVEADGLRGRYATRKIGGLEEVPRRKVGVNEGTLVEKENGFDSTKEAQRLQAFYLTRHENRRN